MFPCPLGAVSESSGAVRAEEDRGTLWSLGTAESSLLSWFHPFPSISSMWLEMQLGHGAAHTCCGCTALTEFHWEIGVAFMSIFLLKWD